jgi:hypothetical protein
VPADHPLRAIRALVDEVLRDMWRALDELYVRVGRPSILRERLFGAQLLQIFYSIRSERLCSPSAAIGDPRLEAFLARAGHVENGSRSGTSRTRHSSEPWSRTTWQPGRRAGSATSEWRRRALRLALADIAGALGSGVFGGADIVFHYVLRLMLVISRTHAAEAHRIAEAGREVGVPASGRRRLHLRPPPAPGVFRGALRTRSSEPGPARVARSTMPSSVRLSSTTWCAQLAGGRAGQHGASDRTGASR